MLKSRRKAGVLSLSGTEYSDFMQSNRRFAKSGLVTVGWALSLVGYHGWRARAACLPERSPKREAS